jgi:hypothetical protein
MDPLDPYYSVLTDLAVARLETGASGFREFEVKEFEGETATPEEVALMLTRVKQRPQLLVRVNPEESSVGAVGSDYRSEIETIPIEVLVCVSNVRTTAEQTRTAHRIGGYVRSALAGWRVADPREEEMFAPATLRYAGVRTVAAEKGLSIVSVRFTLTTATQSAELV